MMKFVLGILTTLCYCHLSHGQGIDELIAGASKVRQLDYLTDLNSGIVMVELDMVYTRERYLEMEEAEKAEKAEKANGTASSSPYSTLERQKRKATKGERSRWTKRTIPYKIARGKFSGQDMQQIRAAIKEWEHYSCLKFTPASSHRDYIYFDDGSGCYSYVGRTGGSQTVGLAGGCRTKGVIVHEIGHAVGFHHEQNRPDRDNHVRINRHNISPSVYYNFKKYPYSSIDLYDVPYDYGSVMHYGGRAFSRNGGLTIETRNKADQHKIGNRYGLSYYDIMMANRMYKCDSHCPKNIKCPRGGFLNKDCKCYCPGKPVRICEGETGGVTSQTTQQPRRTTTRPPCRNLNSQCQRWANEGHCKTSSYMKLYCKPACNLCGGSRGKVLCVDDKKHCSYWAGEGHCTDEYEGFMKRHCKKSCNHCKRSRTSEDGDGEVEGAGEEAEAYESGAAIPSAAVLWACLSSLIIFVVDSISM